MSSLDRALTAILRQLQPRVIAGTVVEQQMVTLTASEARALLKAIPTTEDEPCRT